MNFMKRFMMLILTNILIMLVLGFIFYVLQQFFPQLQSTETGYVMVLSLVWGFGGALISLAMSKTFAKMFHGVKIIKADQAGADERWLIATVHRLAREAGITRMPEVGVWESPEVNAFCTGPSKNSSLVAVSTGILQRMSRDELEGVLGHEISHAANGDMVTMTLVQGVVNSFVIFLSFIIAKLLMRGDDRERGGSFSEYMVRNLLQIVLSLTAAVLIIFPYSRWREFRADAGGANLAGKNKMINALKALQDSYRLPQPPADPALAAFKIGSPKRSSLFATHPSLEERIARLEQL